jgi:hypothetical protein
MRSAAPIMSVPTGLCGSGLFGRPEHHVAAHAGGQVQHDIDFGLADALGHLAVKCDIATRAPVSGSRTWQWTIAAPALAASMALSAICSGERGTCGLRSWVPPDPVTAQVMKTSRFMVRGMRPILLFWAPQ